MLMSGQGSLLIIAFAVVANAKEVLFEAAMTARSDVPRKTIELARELDPA